MTAGATHHETSSGQGAAFEVERFEWTEEDRIELTGAWSGLRGTRFVRPTLEIEGTAGERRRLLALLDHKPWAPDQEGPWNAAFRWDGDRIEIDSVQLHVAPGVVVELPAPAPPGESELGEPIRAVAAAAPMRRRPGKAVPAIPDASASADGARPSAEDPPASAEPALDVEALRAELAATYERAAAAERRVDQLERERDEALAQRRTTSAELEALRQAHGRALSDARAHEREAAAAALADGARLRERVERERDDAAAQREIAYRERDDAVAAKEQALADRKRALADRKQALRDRQSANRERDKALAEAQRAVAARHEAIVERDKATAERDIAVNERDAVISAHERGLPLRPPKPRYLRDDRPEPSEIDIWLPRAVAIVIVGVFLIVILRLFIMG
jgi:hypothetical protein